MTGKGLLIYVIGFGIIMGYIIMNLTSLGTRATENVAWYNSAAVSKNLATIGANIGLSELYQNPDYRTTINQSFDEGPYTGGEFTVTFTDDMINNRLILESVATFQPVGFDEIEDKIIVFLNNQKEDEFKYYSWITSKSGMSGPGNAFVDGDTVWGPLHSNGQWKTSGRPVFHGQVTYSGNWPARNQDQGVYHGGEPTQAAEVTLPDNMDDLYEASLEENGGLHYLEDIWIEIDGENVNIWTEDPGSGAEADTTINVNTSGFSRAVYSSQNVHVEGTLSGKVSIGAGNDIYITNDVRYQTFPPYTKQENGEIIHHSDDLLGLVANNHIEITKPSTGAGGEIDIHAAMIALNGAFKSSDWNKNASGKGVVRTFGTVIMNALELMTPGASGLGVYRRYVFDERFMDPTFRAPHFPGMYKEKLEISSWYESIQLPPF